MEHVFLADRERLAATQAVLVATKAIEKPVPIDQYYTNAFIGP